MATTPKQIQFKNVHSHSMTVLYHEPGTAPSSRWCDVCGHRISLGWYYQCAPCNFDTHMLCAAIATKFASSASPQTQFEHVHSQHPLTLLQSGPRRQCNICGKLISSGSYYQCKPCDFDAHLVCAFISNLDGVDPQTSARAVTALPTKRFERIHSQHQMTLLYTAKGKRVCDVCGHQISLGQYYQCAPCGFDAHILCAIIGNFDPHTSPAATTGSRSVEPMRNSAPAANTGISSVQPTRKSGLETYTSVMSAVGATAGAGYYLARSADWVTEKVTGKDIFDHCREALNAPDSGSAGTSSADNCGSAVDADVSDAGIGFGDLISSFFNSLSF